MAQADATATHFSYFRKIQIGFTFLVPARLGIPGKPVNRVRRTRLVFGLQFRVEVRSRRQMRGMGAGFRGWMSYIPVYLFRVVV